MISTLVIHPADKSSDFMKIAYADKGYDVMDSYQGDINSIIANYQRVIMIGHGWTDGLFSVGQFRGGLAVDKWSIPVLEKKENIYIWCMASTFVERYGLKGYSTGMFISELREADWFNIKVKPEAIEHSNLLFANVMREQIESPNLQQILKDYNGNCPVIQYNRAQMKQFKAV